MDQNDQISNAGTRQIVVNEINKAILRHGAPSSAKADIQARAQLVGGRGDAAIRILCDNGRLLTIDSYLADLKRDPKYLGQFAKADPPKISIHDEESLYAKSQEVANGKIVAADE